jgi:CheY-like chemotaxis protein
MSHEIRTPLTAIIGFAEELLRSNTHDASLQDSLATILNNGRHLLHVINEILDLSKIESDKLSVEYIPTNLPELLADINTTLSFQAAAKGLNFAILPLYPIPLTVNTDPVRLKQVLFNLTSNAIKFTDQGYVNVNVTYKEDSEILNFTIIDTGIGIAQDKLNNLFTPFTQADSSTTRKYGGTGLGLYISKQLIEMLGGHIRIDSIQDLGTKITFDIHIGRINKNNLVSGNAIVPAKSLPVSQSRNQTELRGHILLVDDSSDNQKLIKLLLSTSMLDVDSADNGKSAVELALTSEYDLILMDIQMPVMDGIEATKLLRATGYDKPIIALTANAMQEERNLYLKIGCNDFLSKPIDRNAFFSLLAKYLQSGSSDDEPSSDYEQSYLQLKEDFLQGLPDRSERIATAVNNNDTGLAVKETHKLKGIAGAYGFPEITTLAGILERALREEDKIVIESSLNSLLNNIQTALKNNPISSPQQPRVQK